MLLLVVLLERVFAAICIVSIYFTTDIFTLWFQTPILISFLHHLHHVVSSGGAVDKGLVRELERQEAATRAVQCGHQQRPGRLPHQLPSTTPGYFG